MDWGPCRPWGFQEVVLLGLWMTGLIRIRASEGYDDAPHKGYAGYDGLSRMMVLLILVVIGAENASVAALDRAPSRLEPFF